MEFNKKMPAFENQIEIKNFLYFEEAKEKYHFNANNGQVLGSLSTILSLA